MEKHRHMPVKRNHTSRSGRVWTALIVIFSIILIATIVVLSPVGSFLLDNVVIPVYGCISGPSEDKEIAAALQQQDAKIEQNSPAPKPSEKTKETISIEETPFYILQMGAFIEESDAQAHAEELRRLGAAGVVYPDGSVYRVFAAAYTNETSLVKVQAQVRADGFEATPYIVEKHALKLTIDGDKEAADAIRTLVKLMNTVPETLCGLALAFDKAECDPTELLNRLHSMQKECAEIERNLVQIKDDSIKPIRELIEKYETKLSTFLKEHDTIQTEMLSGDLKHLQLSVIIDYILFFDRK